MMKVENSSTTDAKDGVIDDFVSFKANVGRFTMLDFGAPYRANGGTTAPF